MIGKRWIFWNQFENIGYFRWFFSNWFQKSLLATGHLNEFWNWFENIGYFWLIFWNEFEKKCGIKDEYFETGLKSDVKK